MKDHIKQITLEEFKKKNLDNFGLCAITYKAWINKSADYFETNFGIEFWDTVDNLDYVQIAFFSLDDDLVFLLSYHKRSPVPTITGIEMADGYSSEQVEIVVKSLKSFFQLSPDEIVIPALNSDSKGQE